MTIKLHLAAITPDPVASNPAKPSTLIVTQREAGRPIYLANTRRDADRRKGDRDARREVPR